MDEQEREKELLLDELINIYHEDPEELSEMSFDELKDLYNDITDMSDMLPNETFEEFMEHEDY